jgi:hypothetical protein
MLIVDLISPFVNRGTAPQKESNYYSEEELISPLRFFEQILFAFYLTAIVK